MAAFRHHQLSQIAQIQSLKTEAAQARLVSAKRELREAEVARSDAVALCTASEDAWQASIAVHGMAADVTWSWSDSVRRDDLAVAHAAQVLGERETKADAFALSYRRQLIVRDTAVSVARIAQLKAARKRDEIRLHDVTERLMHRWGRS